MLELLSIKIMERMGFHSLEQFLSMLKPRNSEGLNFFKDAVCVAVAVKSMSSTMAAYQL